jgi:hypothetical protein
MESKLIKEFNLPNYIKGKSFAEASKAIDKKFKDRDTVEATATKEALLKRLADAQEYVKMQDSLKANSQEVPDMMNGQVPQGFEEFAPQNQMFEGGFKDMQGADKAGAVIGDAGTALGFAQDAFGPSGVDTSGLAGRQEMPTGAGWDAAGAGLKGAAAGAKYGPLGAGIGAAIGFGSSILGSNKEKNDIHKGNMNTSSIAHGEFTNPFSDGGYTGVGRVNPNVLGDVITNKFKKDSQNPFDDVKLAQTPSLSLGGSGITGQKNKWQMGTEGTSMKGEDKLVGTPQFDTKVLGDNTARFDDLDGVKHNTGVGKAAGKVAEWGKENYDSLLRAAPIVGNAMQLAKLKKPGAISLDRLDARYKPHQVDERALENKVQNEGNNTQRALAGASNGSMGALRNNIMGVGLNKTNALSDAQFKSEGFKSAENDKAHQFNQRQDMTNLRQGTIEQQMNDQNEGAYNSAKSALQSQLANDIGNFGKERTNMKQVAEMFGYTWDGKYMKDKNGKIIPLSTLATSTETDNKE